MFFHTVALPKVSLFFNTNYLFEVYERMYFDELSDEEADYYNERIRHFENGDYEGTRKVDLNTMKE